jgi:glutaconate CoA-transferase, subunit A
MQIHSRGTGLLFSDPSANHARQAFAGKPRACTDKLTPVAQAVARLVNDGDYLAIGGFGCDRVPTAVVHEILRQRKQNLRFAGHTATHDFQLLCAGNLTGRGKTISKVDAAYTIGLEARGLSPPPDESWSRATSSAPNGAITCWRCVCRRPR